MLRFAQAFSSEQYQEVQKQTSSSISKKYQEVQIQTSTSISKQYQKNFT